MTAGARTQGRRIPDGEIPTEQGDYSKHGVDLGHGERDVRWFFVAPNGHSVAQISASMHCVEENADGTITVRPNPPADPGNSNSICVWADGHHKPGWHGYIYDGVWAAI